jgi:tetratricopeptide (TPR) repeat protein
MSDPGAELLDRIQALWARYGRIASGVVAAVVVIGALGFFALRSRAASEAQAAGKLAQANVLFWQGQYDRSLDAAKQVAQQFGSTPSGNDAHRLAGDDAYWNSMLRSDAAGFKTAITEYRAYLVHAPNGPLADAGRRSLAYALESDKQFAEAAKNYEQLVGAFDRESSAEFLTDAARCRQALGDRAGALRDVQRLVDEFGDTSIAPQARVRVAELQTSKS